MVEYAVVCYNNVNDKDSWQFIALVSDFEQVCLKTKETMEEIFDKLPNNSWQIFMKFGGLLKEKENSNLVAEYVIKEMRTNTDYIHWFIYKYNREVL